MISDCVDCRLSVTSCFGLVMDLMSLTRLLGWFGGALCCGGAAVSGHLVSHEYRLDAEERPHGHRRDDGCSFLCGKWGDADPTSLCRDDKQKNGSIILKLKFFGVVFQAQD